MKLARRKNAKAKTKRKGKFYITTPIYYVNDVPHIGHAYTTTAADILARWNRLIGRNVFFLTGLDENSQKTVQAAKTTGRKSIQRYADKMAKNWKKTWKAIDISNDDFIRTTEARHKRVVKEFFLKVWKKGDIYKGAYEGLYCDDCENFLTRSDLVDNLCPYHKKPPKVIREENYFFKLSKYQKRILKHIKENPKFIQPDSRRNEVVEFIKTGVKDISISRPNIEWGIPLPIDSKHTVWVWFDALVNYLQPKQHWPAELHLVGKDIIRFHCVIWPGMLLSAGCPLPKQIFAHGFFTVNGQKMSKSLGNALDPLYLAKKYSVDALRYYLFREIPFGQDGDFSEESLKAKINNELADIYGNFAHRTLSFIWNNFDGEIPEGKIDKNLDNKIQAKVTKIEELLEDVKLKEALEETMSIAKIGNEYFQAAEPWRSVKTDRKKAADTIYNCVQLVGKLAVLFYPWMPSTSEELARQLNSQIRWPLKDLKPRHKIKRPKPLFKKIR